MIIRIRERTALASYFRALPSDPGTPDEPLSKFATPPTLFLYPENAKEGVMLIGRNLPELSKAERLSPQPRRTAASSAPAETEAAVVFDKESYRQGSPQEFEQKRGQSDESAEPQQDSPERMYGYDGAPHRLGTQHLDFRV